MPALEVLVQEANPEGGGRNTYLQNVVRRRLYERRWTIMVAEFVGQRATEPRTSAFTYPAFSNSTIFISAIPFRVCVDRTEEGSPRYPVSVVDLATSILHELGHLLRIVSDSYVARANATERQPFR